MTETIAAMKISRVLASICLICLFPLVAQRIDAQSAKALLLFGGSDHKTFLGCLNCSDVSPSSVCNDVGQYGSDVQPNSIWNDVGEFGSDVSQYSPWNDVTNDAPVIVDKDGKSYGYFSTNTVHHDRTRVGWLVAVLDYFEDKNDLEKTRKKMCGN